MAGHIRVQFYSYETPPLNLMQLQITTLFTLNRVLYLYCETSQGNTYEHLTLCMLGKNFSRQHFEIVFLFFLENMVWHFMQIVSLGDNLHEVSDLIFLEK